MEYTVFNSNTGEILRSGTAPDEDAVTGQAFKDGESVVIGRSDDLKHWVDPVSLTIKDQDLLPHMQTINTGQIFLAGLPEGTKVVCLAYSEIVSEGELLLEFDEPGEYEIALSCGPQYLPKTITVMIP